MIVNVSGSAIEDYVKTAEIINELDKIPAIELKHLLPQCEARRYGFWCVSAKGASEVVKAVRSAYKKDTYRKTLPKRYGYHRNSSRGRRKWCR